MNPTITMPDVEHPAFGKIPRWNKPIIVTEKIDGSNGLVYIDEHGNVFAGSRNRWITPESDNFGFAKWVAENQDDLRTLGPGRHYGEWWGSGIQRGYGRKNGQRHFSLFNVGRYDVRFAGDKYHEPPACCGVVPVIANIDSPDRSWDVFEVSVLCEALHNQQAFSLLDDATPMEGVMLYHTAAGRYFKNPFDGGDPKSLNKPQGATT